MKTHAQHAQRDRGASVSRWPCRPAGWGVGLVLLGLCAARAQAGDVTVTSGGGGDITLQAPSAGGGDITDVGSCATGACFTSGTPAASLTFNNATSGTVTLQTVSGALGAVTASLPAATGTIVTTGNLSAITSTGTLGSLTVSGAIAANGGLSMPDGQLLDLSAINMSANTEGLKLPQNATACSVSTLDGEICWDTSTDHLYVGTGAAAKQIDTAGTVTSVATGTGLTGGTITTSGTLSLDYARTLASNNLTAGQAVFDSTDNINTGGVLFEGATANTFQTYLTVVEPTADNTISLPNIAGTGTLITTANTTDIGTTTFGSGSDFTWTFNGSGSGSGTGDPTVAITSGALTIAATTTQINGDVKIQSGSKVVVDSNDAGDSYVTHNSTNHYVSVVVDGVEVARFKP